MIEYLNEIFASILMTARQPMEAFIQLETSDDDTTLVTNDGSLVSFVKLLGARQIIGDAEYQWIIEQATLKLGSRFDRPGYAMQICFARDPSTVGHDIDRLMKGNRVAIRALDLDLEDLLNERRRHLARYMAHEDMYIVLWTRPSALSKSEFKKSVSDRRAKKWVKARSAQFPLLAFEALRTRHKSYISSILGALEEIAMKAILIDTHEALNAVRSSIYPQLSHDDWRANLPGDPLMPRAPTGKDASDILWPSLRSQICTGNATIISNSIVRIGNLLWGRRRHDVGAGGTFAFPAIAFASDR